MPSFRSCFTTDQKVHPIRDRVSVTATRYIRALRHGASVAGTTVALDWPARMATMAHPAMRTFLFSDLRDYTAFIETKGDQAATKMLRACRRIVRAAVAKHRGAEIKTEGDSFYVVFRAPSPAVKCAIDIQRGAAAYNARHPDLPVRMGIGINTGEAVPHDKGYVGSAVVIASRLSVSCAAGQIVVTDTVRSLVRTGAHAAMRELGAWTLKGVAEPVRVYEVGSETTSAARALRPALPLPAMLASPTRPVPGLVVCPELVQRERELATLREHLEAASRGDVRIVAVSGEGGIGKSRLVREVANIAHRDGMYVFGGRSHPSGPPYEAFVAALRPYARARGTEILKRYLGPLMNELRRLLPEIDMSVTAAEQDLPSDERRDRFMRTISLLLEDAASQRPVLVVLEDFHEADEASRDVLRHIASVFHMGICIVVLYRDEEVGSAHPLRGLLWGLERDRRLARVTLSALDLAGVERMTKALAPRRDDEGLAPAVFERSQGVPFYVEELLKTALDDPTARPDQVLPRTIEDAVRLRVDRLVASRGPGVADLLEAAAVAEVPLTYETLLRLSGRDEAEASADLVAAVDAQLLHRPPTRSEIYRYRHALTREAMIAAISPARRRRLHARVADALAGQPHDPSRSALLAHHYAEAGDGDRALTHARQAAANAVRVGAYATAVLLLREAITRVEASADLPPALDELSQALQAAGRATEAEEALVRARSLTKEPAALAHIDTRLAAVLQMKGQRAEAHAAAERAVAALAATPGSPLARALLAQAEVAWADGDLRETARLSASALDVARRVWCPDVEVEALRLLGAASTRMGLDDGITHIEHAIRAARDGGFRAAEVNAYLELARALLWRGRNEEGLEAARQGIDLARERGLEFLQARILSFATTIGVNLGRYADARAFAEQAVSLARADTVASSAARMALAHVISDQGEGEDALLMYEQIRDEMSRNEPERQIIFWAYHAQALVGVGRAAEAVASARRAVDLTLKVPGQGMTAFLNAAEVMEARRDLDGISDLSAKFEGYFAGRDTPYIRFTRAEIEAIHVLCEGRDASEAFESAARLYDDIGAQVRALYRRATAAALRMHDPTRRTQATREFAGLRRELERRGAVKYVRLLGALRKGTPNSWIVDPMRHAEVTRAN